MRAAPEADRIASHVPTVAALPAGEYLMGCERGRSDERPVHRVRVDPLAMGITTVTNEQYRFFVGQTGGRMPDSFLESRFSHPQQPVVSVSWLEAAAYCRWLSQWTGQTWRLPTEAEWEWAIRQNGEGCLYAWGDQDPSEFELYRTGWRCSRPMRSGCTTWATSSMNGAWTGMRATTTGDHPATTPSIGTRPAAGPLGAEPGATRSR